VKTRQELDSLLSKQKTELDIELAKEEKSKKVIAAKNAEVAELWDRLSASDDEDPVLHNDYRERELEVIYTPFERRFNAELCHSNADRFMSLKLS